MKSMKTLLRLLGAVSLSTVAASSVVACGGDPNPTPTKEMNVQVKKDFGFLDTNANSLVKLEINVDPTNKLATWKSHELDGITADKLLNSSGSTFAKAKSADAANFLVDVLKLKAESGEGKDRLFKHSDANVIGLEPKTYSPVITKKSDNTDYVITGGTLTINFKKDSKQFGDDYSLNILGDQSLGITANKLPQASIIKLDSFDSIPGFAVGEPKNAFAVGRDLTQYFKTNENEGKTIKNIVNLIKKGNLKITVSTAPTGTGTFSVADIIKVRISIGEIMFATEYTLTIA